MKLETKMDFDINPQDEGPPNIGQKFIYKTEEERKEAQRIRDLVSPKVTDLASTYGVQKVYLRANQARNLSEIWSIFPIFSKKFQKL